MSPGQVSSKVAILLRHWICPCSVPGERSRRCKHRPSQIQPPAPTGHVPHPIKLFQVFFLPSSQSTHMGNASKSNPNSGKTLRGFRELGLGTHIPTLSVLSLHIILQTFLEQLNEILTPSQYSCIFAPQHSSHLMYLFNVSLPSVTVDMSLIRCLMNE